MAPQYGQLSFPPLLDNSKWRNATSDQQFPGGSYTWRKSLQPRPLKHQPSPSTVTELRMATGERFQLLEDTAALPKSSSAPPGPDMVQVPGRKRNAGPTVLFNTIFPKESSMPTFNVWDYCQKHGHAPPRMPQPPISDMKAWFQEYGKPKVDCPPGFRTEFAARTNLVRKPGATDITRTSRMLPGRVLR